MKIGTKRSFWRAALRISPCFWSQTAVRRPVCMAPWRCLAIDGGDGSCVGLPKWQRKSVAFYIDPLIAFVSANAWLAYLTLFLAALLEAVPVAGALVPGSTIILALSALVPGGELKLWGVLAAAIAGALLGDGS